MPKLLSCRANRCGAFASAAPLVTWLVILTWEAEATASKTISAVMSPLEHLALKLKEIRPPG